jgi:3-oxoacyl-[acyl-carrier protein] reductase
MNPPQRVAIVTGAAGGIGRATALSLSNLGYALVLVGRTESTLSSLASELHQQNKPALAIVADISDSDAVDGMVRQVVDTWGRIDVLVNNAGMVLSRTLAETSNEEWHAILNVNLSSAFYATRAVWAVMRGQFESSAKGLGDFGVIVNISSRAAQDPFPGLGAYAIAKVGINMLTRVAAREGASVGIRVVAIAPGGVDTEMFQSLVGKLNVRAAEVLQPEDVAAMVADVVAGSLRNSSGETLYLHRRPA